MSTLLVFQIYTMVFIIFHLRYKSWQKTYISPTKFNAWNSTVEDWHIFWLETPSTEAARSKVPGAVSASSITSERKCGLWVYFAADTLVYLDATCLCLGLHVISSLLLWTECGGSAIHTKGNTKIAIKANTNMENGRREEKRYLLKSGSVLITSLKNMAACEAKPGCQRFTIQHSPVYSGRFAEQTHSSVESKDDTEG